MGDSRLYLLQAGRVERVQGPTSGVLGAVDVLSRVRAREDRQPGLLLQRQLRAATTTTATGRSGSSFVPQTASGRQRITISFRAR